MDIIIAYMLLIVANLCLLYLISRRAEVELDNISGKINEIDFLMSKISFPSEDESCRRVSVFYAAHVWDQIPILTALQEKVPHCILRGKRKALLLVPFWVLYPLYFTWRMKQSLWRADALCAYLRKEPYWIRAHRSVCKALELLDTVPILERDVLHDKLCGESLFLWRVVRMYTQTPPWRLKELELMSLPDLATRCEALCRRVMEKVAAKA